MREWNKVELPELPIKGKVLNFNKTSPGTFWEGVYTGPANEISGVRRDGQKYVVKTFLVNSKKGDIVFPLLTDLRKKMSQVPLNSEVRITYVGRDNTQNNQFTFEVLWRQPETHCPGKHPDCDGIVYDQHGPIAPCSHHV